MEVTCIIPIRNGADTIERAIRSALNAGCENVMVYDDASTDNTRKILDDLANEYPSVVTYAFGSSVRAGVNFARNFLIDHVNNNRLIIPLDCDDELLDITPFVEAYQPDTWVYGDHIECDGTNETYHKGAPAGGLARKNVTGVTFAFHKNDWDRVGGYDPDFGWAEDYAMQVALTHSGIRPVYVPKPLYRRHLKPEGNTRTILAGVYWEFYRNLARSKWPQVFSGG